MTELDSEMSEINALFSHHLPIVYGIAFTQNTNSLNEYEINVHSVKILNLLIIFHL